MNVLIFDDDVAAGPGAYHFPDALNVRIYDRADDCLRLVSQLRPDVVLMDYHMSSSLKGEHAIRQLRIRYSIDALPIIGISSAESLNQKMMAAGANRAVVKKQLQELLLELAEALSA